jgi:GTP-binding protein
MTPFLHTARFTITAAEIAGLPNTNVPEIAFVGRSNAGKSTCINTLAQQKRLAFASKTPGRTQQINYFAVGFQQQTTAFLVDLPGYGYAAVPKGEKERWQRFLADYLQTREQLTGLVLITDSRQGLTTLDLRLLDFMATQNKPVHVLISKVDKLTGNERRIALAKAQELLGDYLATQRLTIDITMQGFSALKRDGLKELSELVELWLGHTPANAAQPGGDATISDNIDESAI